MSRIADLIALVPPPIEPRDANGDWEVVENDLGIVLPHDYKEYIQCYGTGTFCSAFWIPSPFNRVRRSSKQALTARQYWLWWVGIYDDWQQSPKDKPYPIYPSKPGLFPWGIYGDIDALSWYTSGNPDQWHVVYFHQGQSFFDLRGLGFLDFLITALYGSVPLPERVIGQGMLELPREFKPD